MRVLVITRAPWRNDNNTGNTMTNIFADMKDFEFYNLYFREQLPQNDIAIKSFAISEVQLIKNILKRTPVGKEVYVQDITTFNNEDKIYTKAKKIGTIFLSLVREMIWGIGKWKSNQFKNFLKEVKPDIVFMPVFNCFYPHKVLQFVKSQTNAKVVLFHADDNYTLKQFSLSPMYWLYRFNLRRWVRKSVKISDMNYAISHIQKEEYEKAFKKSFKILTKSLDFSMQPERKTEYNQPLQLVFTGNIGVNRWRSLANIANTLEKINTNGIKMQMKIYTATPLTAKMKSSLNIEGSSEIVGYVESRKIPQIQHDADILIHVEAMDLKNKLKVRQSFSTKIVDYLSTGRPILAYGPKTVASIDCLSKNKSALVADCEEELYSQLIKAIDDRKVFDDILDNAYNYAKEYHNKQLMDKMIRNDFSNI